MARGKKRESLTMEEKLEAALVPEDEQLYEVPGNWCWVRLGNLIELHRGVSYKKGDAHSEKQKGDCLILRGGNVGEGYIELDSDNVYVPKHLVSDNQLIRENDIVIVGSTGSSKVIGRSGIARESYMDVAFGAFLIVARPISSFDVHFVDYIFQSHLYRNRIRTLASGVNINNIKAEYITETSIPLPPLAEQHRIVERMESLFSQLDEARDKAQEALDSFENRKAAILQAAFSGRLIQTEAKGLIPLSEIAEEIHIGPFGSALHKEEYIVDGIPVINPKHIVNQAIVADTKVTISEDKAKELSSYRVKENDIILGRRGEMGRSAPVQKEHDGWLCGTGSMIIRLKNGYNAVFYSQIIASEPSVRYLKENAVGSTMSNLNEKIIKNLPVPDYSIREQNKMMDILSKLIEEEKNANDVLEQVVEQIDSVKKSIIAMAFRGELGTNDPEDACAIELIKSIM